MPTSSQVGADPSRRMPVLPAGSASTACTYTFVPGSSTMLSKESTVWPLSLTRPQLLGGLVLFPALTSTSSVSGVYLCIGTPLSSNGVPSASKSTRTAATALWVTVMAGTTEKPVRSVDMPVAGSVTPVCLTLIRRPVPAWYSLKSADNPFEPFSEARNEKVSPFGSG